MKSTLSSRSYMILSGIVLVMLAFVAYMWMDTQELEQSVSPGVEIVPEVSESGTTHTGSMDTASYREPVEVRPSTPQSQPEGNQTARADREPVSMRPPSQRDRPERIDTVKRDDGLLKERDTPMTGSTDDWMFERGEDVEEEKEPMESQVKPAAE